MDRQPLDPEVSIAHPLISFEWVEQAKLPVPMCDAKAAWHNGQLHIGGGVTPSSPRREETRLYSYSLNNSQYATRDTPTYYYGLTVYNDHLVLVGGVEYHSDTITNKVWLLQSLGENGGEEWTEDSIPPMPSRRYGVSAVGHNKLLLVVGGCDNKFRKLDTVEVYNSEVKQWQSTTALPRRCYWLTSAVVGDHLVFVGGEGQKNEVYRCRVDSIVSSLEWERLVDAPFHDSAITLSNGSLLTKGGWRGRLPATMFRLSSQTQDWRYCSELPLRLACTCTAVLPSGQILVIGGLSDSGYSSKVFKLCIKNKAALGLSNIILKGVQSGLLALVERALTVVKEHSHSSQSDGNLLLDFLAQSSSPKVSSIESLCSPLMIACDNKDTKMVDVLLKNGASTSYKNKDDVTALHVACSKDNLTLVQRLVGVERGLTQQAINLLQMTDKEGQSVLHYTCGSPSGSETLKWLLENKAVCDMLNNRTITGYTPLLTACHNANVAAVEVLVTHDRVDTALCDENNQSALHLAAMHDSPSIVELLLENGCPSDKQDSKGNTALHIAYKKSSSSVITVLTRVDDGRIELIMNKAGQHPADIEPDDIIPPEILKKGAKAVQLYFKALMKGKRKIPLCNFLILGEERVGKTSLYHLLVQKPFNPNQDSTRGIDNTIVDTVDTRHVGAEDWAEKDQHTVEQHADQQFVQGVIGALPSDLFAPSDSPTPTVTESELQEQLSKLEPEIQQILTTKKNPPTLTKVQPEDQPQAQPTQPEDRAVPESQVPEKTSEDSHSQAQAQHSDLSLAAEDEDPSTSNQSTHPAGAVPKVSSRHAKLFDQEFMAAASKEKKEPVLILNTLDFAGQKQYRPMHHCFLSRRAMYLVVFNLQHVIRYLEQKLQQCLSSDLKVTNPFEEVRYWLHSIHAHTLPAVSGKEKKPMKNVCLVGTHRAPPDKSKGRRIEDEKLKEINDLIMKEICDDDRCSSHLHFMGPDGDRVFIAVENSIDGKEMKDRKASGAKALQEEIKAASQNLSFLREEYPVIWFRFDSELTRFKESLKRKKFSLVVKVEEVLKVATQCGITDPEGQLLALEFFHETGKIVYLKFLPPLFISTQEHAELEELVILDPTWLFHVMKNVVELNYRSPIEGKLIRELSETGVASSDLLKEAWSGYLREPIEQSFRQMRLILQAEAVIHPIRIIPESALEQSPSESVSKLEAQPPSKNPTTSEAATADEKLEYLVPCKLPEEIKKPPAKSSRWIPFYFDFQKFLPEEIYHRLLCLMLAVSQLKKSFDKPYLSQTMCLFKRIDKIDWCIEFEREKHRLKISVLSSTTDVRSPTHHINTMHTQYLRKICTLSNLEGLRYVGGPLLDPCTQCGETNVIRYVSYFEGEDRPSESECPNCHEGTHQLLTYRVRDQRNISDAGVGARTPSNRVPQDETPRTPPPPAQDETPRTPPPPTQDETPRSPPPPTQDETPRSPPPFTYGPNVVQKPLSGVPTDESHVVTKVTVSDTLTPPHGPKTTEAQTQPSFLQTVDVKPTKSGMPTATCGHKTTEAQIQVEAEVPDIQNLTLVKWTDAQGDSQRCRVIRSIKHKWHEMGRLLGRGDELESISMKHQKDPESCCIDLLQKWLDGGCSSQYPVTWDGLLELLDDLEFSIVAEKLKSALGRQN